MTEAPPAEVRTPPPPTTAAGLALASGDFRAAGAEARRVLAGSPSEDEAAEARAVLQALAPDRWAKRAAIVAVLLLAFVVLQYIL